MTLRTGRRFEVGDDRGGVAIIFALAIVPFLVLIGMSIDWQRRNTSAAHVASALDAAALAAAKAQFDGATTRAALQRIAQDFFDSNFIAADRALRCEPLSVDHDARNGAVAAAVDCRQENIFSPFLGLEEVHIAAAARAEYNLLDIDLALALDTTGSMRGRKIEDLKDAATDFVDQLLSPASFAGDVRIGLAPYASSVNVGGYFEAITGQPEVIRDPRSGRVVSRQPTCVVERPGAFTDGIAAPDARRADTFYPTATSVGASGCPGAAVTPLTNDAAALRRAIADLPADGSTAGHLGATFARAIVAPEWSGIWPADARPRAYREAGSLKIVILMTDGKFNTQYGGGGSSAEQARRQCTAMKDDGVIVYSVAFDAPADAETLLRNCASGPSNFFTAASGAELRAAYRQIAASLMQLRVAA